MAAATPIPRIVLGYGLVGLVPFVAPPLFSLWSPAHAGFLGVVSLGYGALILSFLGGARWGQEVARPAPRFGIISLAMLPTLAGLLLLLGPGLAPSVQLGAMAGLFGLHLLWDVGARDLPAWYPRLRTILTFGAVLGLVAMASIADKADKASVAATTV